MALDGILLSKLVESINEICPCKINKVHNISNTEILLQVRSRTSKHNIMISCHSQYNRINITSRSYPTPLEPSGFIMLLRKHIDGAMITSLIQENYDRWCVFNLSLRNTLGDKVEKKLYIELMGNYANVILVDENNKVLDCLRRIPPFENNIRTLVPGAIFQKVEGQNKKDPFLDLPLDPSLTLTKQVAGFSPLLSREFEYRMANKETFKGIMEEIKASKSLYISYKDKETYFHCIQLKHLKNAKEYLLNEGIDALFFHKEEKDRIKQLTGDIFKVVKKELKHQTQKLPKLIESYEESLNNDIYRVYGELLYANNITDTKGLDKIEVLDFENKKQIIPLDSKLDGKANAKKMFKKYDKLKKSASHLETQIQISKDEIEYFTGINEQLEIIDFSSALEVYQELVNGGYIKEKIKKNKKKQKQNIIQVSKITYKGANIYFGKNNIQNDYITFKLAKKDYTWFHTKDFHGSHVVIDRSDLDEELIRLCANIAAYYSKGRYSSSVPVNYTSIKNIKKISNGKLGKVLLSSYKTIYIDPDESQILELL